MKNHCNTITGQETKKIADDDLIWKSTHFSTSSHSKYMHMTRLETLAKNGKKFSATSTNIACKKAILLRIYIHISFLKNTKKKTRPGKERPLVQKK